MRIRMRLLKYQILKGSVTLQSKASTAEKEDYELPTTKKLDKERQVIVVKPSDVEYKVNSITEYTPTEEQDMDKGEQIVTAAKAKAKEAGQSFTEMIKTLGKKTMRGLWTRNQPNNNWLQM